jgi:hypothetical protein
MAIDDEDKRRAAQSTPWQPVLPTADGTIDQADRQQVAGVYPGVLAGEAAAPKGGLMLLSNHFNGGM